ncbi:hypothetical protein PYJP_09130 [Pyrofollis japonicus]|uniref:helix-turn-helix domain-containing protein n=1 Tax=Pyrofollis japonicus TaxID=3060460 RepID=UPI00295C1885|nr:helix-turn-helix domain-containing protein [Pyrofollis japonicus]BEP17561.1 hypothetical protein PYJP_09130 [Pyrofollis japonicus]
MPQIKLSIERLASTLVALGFIYVSVDQLARLLGVSTKTAGRILAEMHRRGLVRKWSKRTYKLNIASLALGEKTLA